MSVSKIAKKNEREQDIVNAILDYLSYRRISHVHVRNTGAIIKRDGQMFFARSRHDQRGAPDIIFAVKGHAVACEVKTSTGVLSEFQKDWLTQWKNSPTCGSYLVARSVDDVESFLGRLCAA